MKNELPKETQEKISQLQMLEQAMQNSALQVQQLNAQLLELDSAVSELGKTENAFKIVGNLMINTNKDELKENLQKKKESVELRLQTLEKQEERLKDKAKNLQEEIMKTMKKE